MLRLVIFVVASVGFVLFSPASLRNPRSHGFYRFFAWEFILILFLLNMKYWFRDPFSPTQIVAWILLFASPFLAIHGFLLLRGLGKPKDGFEDTTILVTGGVYKYIRHPLYASLLLMGWGIFFKEPSLLGGVLVLAITGFLTATAKVEEAEVLDKFGEEYADYMKKTKMFVPFVL